MLNRKMTEKTLIALALAVCILAWPTPVPAQSTEFFPVDDLREGMRGVGKTVFHGTTIEEFEVEILGVLKNSAPKQDMVLARLSGGPLAETGIMQGMSGSPVYIDGRLVGAVAFAFPFASVAIAGIQPIGQMVGVLSDPPEGNRVAGAWPAESPRAYVNRVMVGLASGAPFEELMAPPEPVGASLMAASLAGTGLAPIRTPLFISGASALAINRFSGLFETFGFAPVQAGGQGSAASLGSVGEAEIVPGSAISAELVRGDISLSANGTVTHVDGDRVYAFGHPFQSTGPTSMPMSSAYVITLIPNLSNSFKIAVPIEVVGAFSQDRATGMSGRVGATPHMIPVGVTLETSRSRTERYDYEIVNSVVAWIGAEMEFALSQAVASGDTFEHRPSECGHCVQDFLADLDLRDLPGEAAGSESGADDALPPADLRFYPAALVVPCGHLPCHAAVAADLGNMAIPNGWIPRRLRSDHCVLWRRYNHIQGLPIPMSQHIPCGRSIIGAVRQEARDRGIELIQEPG